METDTQKLTSHCCGLDYRVDGKEDPKLGPDSDYPDWLFTMNVERPLPTSDQMEPGTLEYYIQLREEHNQRWKRLHTKRRKNKK